MVLFYLLFIFYSFILLYRIDIYTYTLDNGTRSYDGITFGGYRRCPVSAYGLCV